MTAYSEIVKQARIAAANPKPKNKPKKSGETSETTTPIASNESNSPKVPSLYKAISNVFESTSVYLINSAINEAKGTKKSQDELLKLEIQTLKTQIQKVENRIARILHQKLGILAVVRYGAAEQIADRRFDYGMEISKRT